jgi:hypothetical protein
MQKLLIEKTDETAGILLDKHKGVFEISGRSLPEDSAEFFEPVLKWIREYGKDPNETTDFVFKMEYSNTASSKFIHEILIALQSIKNTKVIWWFQEDDEDMEEAGQEFSEQVDVDIPFEFKSYP